MNKEEKENEEKQKSFPQVFCINARKMAYFGRNMQVFRTIHRLFHSFTHREIMGVGNFFSYKNAESGLTNREICGIIVWKKERN